MAINAVTEEEIGRRYSVGTKTATEIREELGDEGFLKAVDPSEPVNFYGQGVYIESGLFEDENEPDQLEEENKGPLKSRVDSHFRKIYENSYEGFNTSELSLDELREAGNPAAAAKRGLASLIAGSSTAVYGPAVIDFLLQDSTSVDALEVMTGLGSFATGIYLTGRFLMEDSGKKDKAQEAYIEEMGRIMPKVFDENDISFKIMDHEGMEIIDEIEEQSHPVLDDIPSSFPVWSKK